MNWTLFYLSAAQAFLDQSQPTADFICFVLNKAQFEFRASELCKYFGLCDQLLNLVEYYIVIFSCAAFYDYTEYT